MSIRRSQRKLQWFATIACTGLLVLLSNLLPHPIPQPLSSQSAPGSSASIQSAIEPQLEPHPIVATFSSLLVAPANAQAVNVRDLVPLLYEALPYIPLENDYQDLEGDPAPQSTLLSRFVRYHTFTQQRSPLFRLDWKLTLADYLGQNETMFRDSYPNHNTLTENPFESDIEAIRALTRAQREELVNTLVDLLNPRGSQPASATVEDPPTAVPPSQQRPAAGTGSPAPQEPRPGDAELLLQ